MVRRRSSRSLILVPALAALAVAACRPAGNESANAGNQSAEPSRNPQDLVSSEYDVVRGMLDLAGVTANDLVADLGSGDGRIPILAAKERGARGLGVEIDRARIRQSNANASAAGVATRVQFRQQDLFQTPLNDVTVLTLYLLPEINLQLRPRILSQMRPGTRVVSNTFDMGDWRPDQRRTIGGTNIFLWIVPAQVEGRWRLTRADAAADLVLTQNYQDFSGTAGNAPIADAQLRGDRIAFTADLGQGRQRFEGRVADGRMSGEGWQAVRTSGP
jgi:SAM-dependent methyltransferase